MTDLAALRRQMEERLAFLAERVEHVEEELRAPVSKSFEEQATEREFDEVNEDLEEAGLAEIAAIRAALARMDRGTYGICVRCGASLTEARLVAVPHAALCIDCATEAERASASGA